MTQPLPPLVLVAIVFAFIFAALSIYSGIKMLKSPKDTRLNTLIRKVSKLTTSIDKQTKKSQEVQPELIKRIVKDTIAELGLTAKVKRDDEPK